MALLVDLKVVRLDGQGYPTADATLKMVFYLARPRLNMKNF